MLYALTGNGNPNRKEVISTLETLRDAVYKNSDEEEFWMLFVDFPKELSEACSDIVTWAIKKNVPFEVVTSYEDLDEWTNSADTIIVAEEPLADAIKVLQSVSNLDDGKEGVAMMVLSDDVYEDESALVVAEECAKKGISVFDLGGQMTELIVETVDTEPTEQSTPAQIESEVVDVSREDLENLTLTELKSLVDSSGVVPRDMRSKESLIEALLREEPPVITDDVLPEEEMFEEQSGIVYALISVSPSGDVRSYKVNQDDASWLINPDG